MRHVDIRVPSPRPLVLAVVLGVFALVLPAAPAGARPSRTVTCSTITVKGGSTPGKVRVVRIGQVSCAKARSLGHKWFKRRATGRCGRLNNFCLLHFRGGWSCSIFSAGEQRTAGGAGAGCFRPHPRTKIRFYPQASGAVHPPPRHLREFLSPDHNVWCQFISTERFCVAKDGSFGRGERSARFLRSGAVELCHVRRPSLRRSCFVNFGKDIPVLRYGQRSKWDGVLCSSKRNGVTCVLDTGPRRGHGFRINRSHAVRVTAGGAR